MDYLWIVSVGVTDLQFPVWKQNEFGDWQSFRFEIGRSSGIRDIHTNLFQLYQQQRIAFPDTLPEALSRQDSQLLKLTLEQNDQQFQAGIDPGKYPGKVRISQSDNPILISKEQALPVYCSKIHDLLGTARNIFKNDSSVSVVVLNTCRANQRDEPIASGPLVAAYLGQKLGLEWSNQSGAIPESLNVHTSTWVDILKDDEKLEDKQTQQNVVERLTATIRAWNCNLEVQNQKIIVTTTGGMPPLKPLIERIPAICLGQQAISLLEQPERAPGVEVKALSYLDRIAEQETLRFHCVEALRELDYVTAYGLAYRYRKEPWSKAVIQLLGPLLELGNRTLMIGDQQIDDRLVLTACQIEISLCMGDSIGALQRLGVFIEAAIWKLIESDQRVLDTRSTVDRDEGYLKGGNTKSIPDKLLKYIYKNISKVENLTISWPQWLKNKKGNQIEKANALNNLVNCYNNRVGGALSIRSFRNHLVHGDKAKPLNIIDLDNKLRQCGLMHAKRKPFGENFLSCDVVCEFILMMEINEQVNSVSDRLARLTEIVIWGKND